ncbi:actin-like ATPase domain-containing [Fusarium acutatum]|uniref:Actin-like ATPase domain-containing n=1 Tax=Fusarium acutatum TaxID=78861 RepID=A0A8H4NER2_9HYPO|nr:actin-like ATPase domain-containing [Fusarium acutatum]
MLGRRSAGPTQLNVVTEPEAAALSNILDRYDSVKQGNVYVVCDVGGGTVDLITYEIESINPIRMRKAVLGQGELCGGVFIDEAFDRKCRERLGPTWKALSRGGKNEIMKSPGSVHGHASERNGLQQTEAALDDTTKEPLIKRGKIHFKEADIKETFTKVYDDIVDLITSQIEKAEDCDLQVTGIILVGGLGGSPYLYSHLQEIFSEDGIDVLQPNGMKPRTEICQGAVCKAFTDGGDEVGQKKAHKPITVTSTISRAHYGVTYDAPCEEGKHLEEGKVWDSDQGEYRAENQMEWYLKKGDCVSKSERLSQPFYRIYDTNWDGCFSDTIYQCEETDPPERLDSTVEEVCTMDCTLENCMPVSRLKNHFMPKGKKMKMLNFKVRMLPTGRIVNFDVEVNGTRLGKANLDVEFD